MANAARTALRKLAKILYAYGPGQEEAKLIGLRMLEAAELPQAGDVLQLHEALCFLHAYPDGPALLEQVERMLNGFERRKDLRRHRRALADTGLAGTRIHYTFFWPTARWLTLHWGSRLEIDWPEYVEAELLDRRLHLLALHGETPGLDECAFSVREWLQRMKGPEETDAAFLVRRFAALQMPDEARETFYQELKIPMILQSDADTPSRTRAFYPPGRTQVVDFQPRLTAIGHHARTPNIDPPARTPVTDLRRPISYQTRPLSRGRPNIPQEIKRAPLEVRSLSRREGEQIVDLARAAMVTRARDLDAFAYGDPDDVRLFDCGDGLQFAVIGVIPDRRLLLESVYGFLTLKNGVPIGYVLTSALFGSSEVAYNVFETYRGAEAATIYGRVLAVTRHIFDSDTFTVFPYQLGHENEEGLRSGAWWFYQKLGFRPLEASVLDLMQAELRRMERDPGHRSSLPTLRKLAAENVYLFLGRPRTDCIGLLAFSNIGLRVTRYLADRFGSDRERATKTCLDEAMELVGLRSMRGFSPGERLVWARWAPLVAILPGIARWRREDRTALAAIIRAKGGARESEFVRLSNPHRPLKRALSALAAEEV